MDIGLGSALYALHLFLMEFQGTIVILNKLIGWIYSYRNIMISAHILCFIPNDIFSLYVYIYVWLCTSNTNLVFVLPGNCIEVLDSEIPWHSSGFDNFFIILSDAADATLQQE